ncbi:hypothetical protein, variant [Aphanomyces invadans]|uniref:Uncharacterized protein n=1 Tax=Aphanomyces invadans TaxID=157072 RepID=A0A024TM44_9STRA|nr:hypothetical protein, variant [Aphanomyces invadans]ETV94701.1 hypothetical protein, variant [Aphanomyces invadans]|eukprot:XP_008876645.1 hypothetical protein, variant [Aphanomyces invadans]
MAREDSGAADPTNFSTLDTAICMSYLVSVLVVGGIATYVSRKKTTLDEYYLGGRTLPWWMLGIADVSSYIDIAGTMINTGLIYALGVRGMFIEVRGGLCLFLAFQLAFTGKLARRCPVRTKGEWIKFRFGAKVGGRLARTAVAIVSLIGGIFSVAYFSIGGGKFVTEFVAVPAYAGLPPDFWASGILMAIALMYTIVAGFTSMVLTDIYQSLFIYPSFVAVSIWGMQVTLPAEFHVFLPTFNTSSFLNVTTTHDAWTAAALSSPNVPAESPFAMYNSFRGIVFLYLTLQCLRSASGPGGGGLQTVLATKSELDVRKQSMLAMLLLLFRWAFGAAIAVLAIHYTIAHPNVTLDAEKVVPFVLANVLPSGYRGFVVASLLAAALTTFDSTIHSASSYWTIDIYHAILHPRATAAQLVFQARLSTVVILLLGWLLSLGIVTINRIWGFMTIAMCGGVVYPFFLSWYWARFNGAGCAAGLVTGIVAAATIFFAWPHVGESDVFLWSSTASGFVSIVTAYLSPATTPQTLNTFYKFVRPPGLWREVFQVFAAMHLRWFLIVLSTRGSELQRRRGCRCRAHAFELTNWRRSRPRTGRTSAALECCSSCKSRHTSWQ